jgi:ATP-dependent helicase/DNAse subunit B
MCVTQRIPIVIYGYFRGRPEEIRLIEAVAGEGSEYYLPCGDVHIFKNNRKWRDELLSHGWKEDPKGSASAAGIGNDLAKVFGGSQTLGLFEKKGLRAFSFGSIEEEVRFVLGEVKTLVGNGASTNDIAIVCEQLDEYAAVFSAASEEYGLPIILKHNIPLASSRIGVMVRDLFEALSSEMDFEPTVRFMMHPYGPGFSHSSWRSIRKARPASQGEWTEHWPDIRVLDTANQKRLLKWVQTLRNWMDTFGTRDRAAESAAELSAYYVFFDALNELARHETSSQLSFSSFQAFVADVLSSAFVPFSLRANGVEILTPDTIIGGKYKHVYVVGLAEGMHPPAISDNVVVDFHDRKLLSVDRIEFESAADIARWASATFHFCLLTTDEALTLSYPRSVQNKGKLPSPFFDALRIFPKTERLSTVSSVEEWRRVFLASFQDRAIDPDIAEIRRRFEVEVTREASGSANEYSGFVGRPLDASAWLWSVSQLTQLGQCPFKWFAARVLRLAIDEESTGELHPTLRGSLYHRTLELAVLSEGVETDIRSKILNNLEQAFSQAEADPEVGLPALPNWELQRSDHLNHLRKAVASPEFIKEDARVVGVEVEFRGNWEGLEMIGYIDRVDETSEGLVAIDYKTSSKAPLGVKDPAGKLSVDIQLPVYTDVALRRLYPDKELGVGAYYSLTTGKEIKRAGLEGMKDLIRFPEKVKQTLAEGKYPVDPDIDWKACTQCDFDPVCRKRPRPFELDAG